MLGLGSGYLQKLIQIGTTIIVVPLLISDMALGLSGYGQLMTLLTVMAFFSMVLDGLRLSVSRKVGQQSSSKDHGLGISVVAMMLALFLPILILALYGNEIYVFVGLGNIASGIILLSVIFLFSEQLNYVLEQYYHSSGLTWKVNSITMIEVVVRFLVICVAIFSYQFSILTYLFIFAVIYLLKLMYFIFDLFSMKVFSSDFFNVDKKELSEIFKYSFPLSLKGVATFFVYRFGVIVCNKTIGPDAAAVYSLIFTTIKNYLGQIFVAVLRPMVIPITAAKNIKIISKESQQSIRSLLRVYEFFVVGAIFIVAFCTDYWLELWLGDKFMAYSALFALSIMVVSLEVVSGVKALLLVSQGYGKSLSFYSLFFALVLMSMLFFIMATEMYASIDVIIYITLAYILAFNGVALMKLFKNRLSSIDYDSYILKLMMYVCSASSYFYFHEMSMVLAFLIGVTVYVIMSFFVFKGIFSDFRFVFKLFLR